MKLHGIHVPHRKNTADSAPVRLAPPKTVAIPMSMHIGKPAKVIVKRGDEVRVGTKIGEADGFVSSPIHSSVSGKVQKIDEITIMNGMKVPCVLIDSDGEQTPDENLTPPAVSDYQSFVDAVRDSGSVGLGGAGFPTHVKLTVKDLSQVQEVVINAAECEPYITSDTRTMLDKSAYIQKGIELLRKYLGVQKFVIGIENNKPAAIAKMQELARSVPGMTVKVLPAMYPQGGEKVLVYNTTGKLIPKGGLPLHVGVIVLNVTTLAFIAEYIETGMPLVEKCVTVDGSAVNEPKNVIVPIGTPVADLLEMAGGAKEEPAKALYGGPMMGIAIPSLDSPVMKNTNAIIFMGKKEATPPKTTPCISCGMCVNHCPLRLDPREIALAYKKNAAEDLEKLHVDLCMECGCCAFICPAHRPLVQTNKLAKAVLRNYQNAKKEEK